MSGWRTPLQRRSAALVGVWAHSDLRRLTLAWGAFFVIDWTSLVALSVWAFDEGGSSAVGLVGVCRLLPGALALPFGAWAADRFPRHRVVMAVFVAQSMALIALIVAVSADSPLVVAYVLVAVGGIVAAPYRPAHLALLPLVAGSADELVAANIAAGVLEGVATLGGPALAGVLLLNGSPSLVLGVALAAGVLGGVAVMGVRPASDPTMATKFARESPVRAVLGGFHVLRHEPRQALIVGCFVLQLLVRGVLTVMLVLVSFDLLGMGESGVGWLGAAMGVGGTLGAVLAVRLTGRRRLGHPYAVGLVLWGAPIAVIGLLPSRPLALVALGVVGVGNAVLDVSGFTLLQRLGDDRMLGRVFGVQFTVGIALGGVGALLAPALVSGLGLRGALITAGAVLPIASILALPGLRRIDATSEPPGESLAVLAGLDLLGGLAPTTLEKLAARSEIIDVEAGTVVVSEGQQADRFYVIVDGEVDVTSGGVLLNSLGPGDHFGEVGLVRRVPRTATVRAITATRLVSLAGPAFIDSITGHEAAFGATYQVIDDRLQNDATLKST
jgi:MFS family permease